MTPYYEQDGITIYHGDCREVLPSLDLTDALVATDPPYGIGWKPRVNHQDQAWVDERLDVRVALGGRHHCFWGGNYFTDLLPPSEAWLVWVKRPAGFDFDDDRRSYSVLEMAWTDYGCKPRMRHQVWDGGMRAGAAENRSFCHPAQKPIEVMRWSIDLCPSAVGMVVDPFMGSGTTLRAAKDAGLRAVGVEVDERYCELAVSRLAQGSLFGEAS